MKTRTLISMVSGVTYEGRQFIIAKLAGNEPARIVPEPDNRYDPNALAVHVATSDGVKHVGYIPRNLAKQIAPALDGEQVMVEIIEKVGDFEGGTLGLRIRIEYPEPTIFVPSAPVDFKELITDFNVRRDYDLLAQDERKYYAKSYPDNDEEFVLDTDPRNDDEGDYVL